jgi:hypothetical protein
MDIAKTILLPHRAANGHNNIDGRTVVVTFYPRKRFRGQFFGLSTETYNRVVRATSETLTGTGNAPIALACNQCRWCASKPKLDTMKGST